MEQTSHERESGRGGGLLSSETLVGAALLFMFSLATPVFIFTADSSCRVESERGISVLFSGWASALGGNDSFSWYANPLVLLALFLGRRAVRQDMSSCALLIAIVPVIWALQLDSFRLDSLPMGLNAECTIGKYGAGFYLWHLSILTASVYSIIPAITHLIRVAKGWSEQTKKFFWGVVISLLPAPVFAVKDTTISERFSVGFASVDEEVTTVLCAMAVVVAGTVLSLYAQYMTNWSLRAKIFSFPALVVGGTLVSLLSLLTFTPLISALAFYIREITSMLIDNPRVMF